MRKILLSVPHLIRQRVSAHIQKLLCFHHAGAQVRLHLQSRLLPFLSLLAIGWYLVSPGQASAGAAAGLTALFLGTYLWARSMALHVSAARTLHYTAFQVGDEMEECIRLENRSSLPLLWVELVDHSNLPGHAISSVRAAGAKSVNEWRFRSVCTRRGVYHLGPWAMALSDPFGIFRVEHRFTGHEEILVYPPLARVTPQRLAQQAAFDRQRLLQQALPADNVQAFGTRRYQPGDPLRRIHWKTVARRSELYVKEFIPEASVRAWLLPDVDAGVQVGSGDDSSLEKMVLLLATLANQLLRDGFETGLYLPGQPPVILPPQRGIPYFWRLLRAIAPLEARLGQALERSLGEIQMLVAPGDTLVILTPSLSPRWPQRLRELTPRLQMQVHLLDPASFGGQNGAPAFQSLLMGLGFAVSLLRSSDIQPIPGSYGPLRRWEFQVLSTGRLLVRRTPAPAYPKESHLEVRRG